MRLGSLAVAGLLAFMTQPAFAVTQTLQDALAEAYRSNPDLQAARAKLRATDEQVSQALSGWRPSVDAVAGAGSSHQKIASGSMAGDQTLSPRDVGIRVTQPMFRGFRTQAAVRAAEANVLAGRARLKEVEQQILFEVAATYLDVAQSQTVLDLTFRNEEVLRKQLEETTGRFNVGEVTKTDVSQSEARLSAATATRTRAEGALANDHATFLRLVGDQAGALTSPKLVLDSPRSADEAAAMAVKNNPAVLAALHGQDAAEAGVTTAEGSLLPEVDLVGGVSRGWEQSIMQSHRQDDATIMARMTIPLYRSGADYAKTRAARQTVTQQRLELESARHKARELAVRAWQNLLTARSSIAAHKSEGEATALALRGVQEERKAGTRTTLDVLNAEQEMLNAKVNLVKAEHDEALAILQIKAALGALTAEALALRVDVYNPVAHYDDVRGKWIGLGTSEK